CIGSWGRELVWPLLLHNNRWPAPCTGGGVKTMYRSGCLAGKPRLQVLAELLEHVVRLLADQRLPELAQPSHEDYVALHGHLRHAVLRLQESHRDLGAGAAADAAITGLGAHGGLPALAVAILHRGVDIEVEA